MDSRVGVTHPHVGEGEKEHPHEKKSTNVLKMVKAKAKKIKDTLTKHGHDEEGGKGEEMVEDPKVHGAPTLHEDPLAPRENPEAFTSQTRVNDPPKSFTWPGQEESHKEQPRVNFEKKAVMGDVHNPPQNIPISIPPGTHQTRDSTDPSRTFVHDQEGFTGQPKVNQERPSDLKEDPAASKERLDASSALSNYQSKVTDPTGKGGEEAGITPFLHSFDKMKVYDEPEAEEESKLKPRTHDLHSNFPTESHDQFSPEPIAPKPITSPENPQSNPEATNMTKSQDSHEQSNQSSYTEKIYSATSAIAGKPISAKNDVASKLGYGEKDNINTEGPHEGGDSSTANNKPASAVDYGKKIATIVTGSDQQGENGAKVQPDNAVAGKPISAKNDVASKLGYGEKDNINSEGQHEGGDSTTANNKPASAVDYGKKLATIVTGSDQQGDYGAKVQPDNAIAGKPISAKNYVASKLGYGEKDNINSEGQHEGGDSTTANNKPASTGVISDTLHNRKEEPASGNNRKEEPASGNNRKEESASGNKPMGKESEDVAKVLSTGDENSGEKPDSSISNSPGKGVVDQLKGAVGSWFGGTKSEESH